MIGQKASAACSWNIHCRPYALPAPPDTTPVMTESAIMWATASSLLRNVVAPQMPMTNACSIAPTW